MKFAISESKRNTDIREEVDYNEQQRKRTFYT